MNTRDWNRALKKIADLESPDSPMPKPIGEAVAAWDAQSQSVEASRRRYRRILRRLEEFCAVREIGNVGDLDMAALLEFRTSRTLARTTSARELQVLRQFFDFCVEANWLEVNPARKIKPPPNAKPRPIEPYTVEEVGAIISACDRIGRTNYERLRARAMVLLMRFTGLRISDVATLARNRVNDGKIRLFTQKTGGHILLPIPPEVESALSSLPVPRGAGLDRGYFFWNGLSSQRTVVGRAERTMAAVFRQAKVPGGHSHRFRHTLATDILVRGGTEQDVADILGISPNIVRKHYAKWTAQRQERIFGLMQAVQSATKRLHSENLLVIQ